MYVFHCVGLIRTHLACTEVDSVLVTIVSLSELPGNSWKNTYSNALKILPNTLHICKKKTAKRLY